MEFQSAFSERTAHEFGIEFGIESRTKQSHQDETDINLIMAKYVKTGIMEHSVKWSGQYAFATAEDFQSSMNIVQKANEMFDELPSKARTKFQHNPAEFLAFVQDPANEDQLFDLGLSDIPPEPILIEGAPPPIVETLPAVTPAE